MRDNSNNEIRLVIGDVEISGWDNVTADSQIDTPADNWNLSLFRTDVSPCLIVCMGLQKSSCSITMK